MPVRQIVVHLHLINLGFMKTVAYIDKDAVGVSKVKKTKQTCEVAKTPESELMSVEEYFDIVWSRYLEKYEKLQG